MVTFPTLESAEVPLAYSARISKLCRPLARPVMTNERAAGRCALWSTQGAPGALEASENDWRPDVVPTPQCSVTVEHDGMAEMLTVPNGGAVVVGTGAVVVVGAGTSSSSVNTDTELSLTTS